MMYLNIIDSEILASTAQNIALLSNYTNNCVGILWDINM